MQLGNLQYYFATRDAVAMAVISAEAEGDILAVKSAMEAHDDPKATLASIVQILFTRWRGESGLIFAILTYLCLHKPEFAVLKKQIYATFYQSLESVIRSIDATAAPVDVRQRIALITAIMDGSVQQVTSGSRTFVDAVTTSVIEIASGRDRSSAAIPSGKASRLRSSRT